MRERSSLLWVALLFVSAVSCRSVLGLDNLELVDDGATGGSGGTSSGSGGSAGSGGIAQECTTAADCTGALGECDDAWECPANTCVKVFKPGGEPCNQGLFMCSGQGFCGECIFDERRCTTDNTIEVCTAEGEWQTAPAPCEGVTPVCSSGACQQVLQIGLGISHHCAVIADGTVRCWGDDYEAQLGQGTIGTTSDIPVEVMTIHDATEVAVTSMLSCARRANDSLWCWGKLRVYNGTTDDSVQWLQPTEVAADIIDFDLGDDAICYITNSGSVMCVGSGFFDEDSDSDLEFDPDADETGVTQAGPVGIANGLRVSFGDYALCVIDSSFDVQCAGHRDSVGDDSIFDHRHNPAPVPNLTVDGDHDIAGGDYVTCVGKRTEAGELRCWGRPSTWQETPAIYGTATMTAPGVGYRHFCALDGGDVKCRGGCTEGQCGTNENTFLYTATTVLSNAKTVWAGGRTSCAQQTDNQVLCWGNMNNGQTGSYIPCAIQWVSGS